jgi:hypothetical protein
MGGGYDMKNNRFETQAEIFQALLSGKKISSDFFSHSILKYARLVNGKIMSNLNGTMFEYFDRPDKWFLYEEPKPKYQVWQWRHQRKVGGLWGLDNLLLTEQDAALEYQNEARYEKHAGPFEVEGV